MKRSPPACLAALQKKKETKRDLKKSLFKASFVTTKNYIPDIYFHILEFLFYSQISAPENSNIPVFCWQLDGNCPLRSAK